MSYTHRHLLLRFNGTFGASVGNPIDKWSAGLRVAVPGQDIDLATPALVTLLNACHTAAATYHSGSSNASTNCFFTHVTGARIGTDGKYDPAGQLTQVSTGTPQAGTGTLTMPWSTSLSVGLRTAAPRGYASNGRIYWPICAGTLTGATGRINASTASTRLSGMQTLIRAVNTAAAAYQAGAVVCVMSSVGTGKTERVLSIRQDDRLDSIERRENDQASIYATLPI